MQIDMHYYGTWALAKAAGLRDEICTTIATAAQYVDDNIFAREIKVADGARLDTLATSRTPPQVGELRNDLDQRLVWVPYHFLPGGTGADYTGRLVCRHGTKIAAGLVAKVLEAGDAAFAVELTGIAAHVLADTFSHYGFSGVSSRKNRVVAKSIRFDGVDPDIKDYITGKAQLYFERKGPFGGMFRNVRAHLLNGAEEFSGALGHGAVATYPDRPYLRWRFTYEQNGKKMVRDNPTTFLQACRAMHSLFRSLAVRRPDLAAGRGMDFEAIAAPVAQVLAVQAPQQGNKPTIRVRQGDLFFV